MPTNALTRSASQRAGLAAAWLSLGGVAQSASAALTAAALLAPWLAPTSGPVVWLIGAALLCGLGQCYFALRTAFDRSLFAGWCAAWAHPEARAGDDMAELDAALGRATAGAVRTLDSRIAGARRLLRLQFCCLAAQALAMGGAAALMPY